VTGSLPTKSIKMVPCNGGYIFHQGGAMLLVGTFFFALHILTPVDLLINGVSFVRQPGFNFETSVVFSNKPQVMLLQENEKATCNSVPIKSGR
jgi:hypothetical protein